MKKPIRLGAAALAMGVLLIPLSAKAAGLQEIIVIQKQGSYQTVTEKLKECLEEQGYLSWKEINWDQFCPQFPADGGTQNPVFPDCDDTQTPETPETPDEGEQEPTAPDAPDEGDQTPENPGEDDSQKPEIPDGGDQTPENPDEDDSQKPVIPDGGNQTPEMPDKDDTNQKPDGGGETVSSFAKQVVALVNQERAKEGLSPLKIDADIEKAALVRAKEIQSSFSHTRPDGSSFSTALQAAGVTYRSSGENIAWGQKSPEEVMKAWMNSPGHRANIMNQNFSRIGVGHLKNGSGISYWVQLFAN